MIHGPETSESPKTIGERCNTRKNQSSVMEGVINDGHGLGDASGDKWAAADGDEQQTIINLADDEGGKKTTPPSKISAPGNS